MSTPPKPEDFLDPANFPDDLKWVPAHYKINPSDPVYLLIAWHWRRVKQSEDNLTAINVQFQRALNDRINQVTASAETVASVNEALADVRVALEEKPAELEAQLDAKLSAPVADAVTRLQTLEKSLAPLARSFQATKQRELLTMFVGGATVGILIAAILLIA